jgi:hypothetical protein
MMKSLINLVGYQFSVMALVIDGIACPRYMENEEFQELMQTTSPKTRKLVLLLHNFLEVCQSEGRLDLFWRVTQNLEQQLLQRQERNSEAMDTDDELPPLQ